MWLLINGNAEPNKPGTPLHFTYQGNINVEDTYVGPPNKIGDAPRMNCKANCSVTNTTFMATRDVAEWPAAARSIVAKAGPH
jgi:hypothetical protein